MEINFSATNNNPFKQSHKLWKIKVNLPYKFIDFFSESLEENALSIIAYELIETTSTESYPDDDWCLELLLDQLPPQNLIDKINILAKTSNVTINPIIPEELIDEDWVSKVQANFPPFDVGKFTISSSKDIKTDNIPIYISAGRAFGTGEHQTTSLCLQALSDLENKYTNMLDMGCGSGILAIAMAKLWSGNIFAIDIDEESIKTACNNFEINNCAKNISAISGDGFNCQLAQDKKPYDLICANILAKPLISMSKLLSEALNINGIVILSGLIETQSQDIIDSYQANGLKLLKKYNKDDWVCLIMVKSA
jgi:ribosomal protein L11 methyltransferase